MQLNAVNVTSNGNLRQLIYTHKHTHRDTHMHNADSVAHASIIRRVVCVGFQQALQMKERKARGGGRERELATLPWQFAIGNWQLAFFVSLLNLFFIFFFFRLFWSCHTVQK